jgi:hypothetical protein
MLILIHGLCVFAEKKTKNPHNGFYLSGKIEGGSSSDSVRFKFFASDFADDLESDFDYHGNGISMFLSVVNKDGHFYFNLPDIGHYRRIEITSIFKGKESLLISTCLTEKGDSIFLKCRPIGNGFFVQITGRGSEKYTCQTEIEQSFQSLLSKINEGSLYKMNQWRASDLKVVDDLFREGPDKILARYHKLLTAEQYQIIRADCIGMRNGWILDLISDSISHLNTEQLAGAIGLLQKCERENRTVSPDIAIYSVGFLEALQHLARLKIFVIAPNSADSLISGYPLRTMIRMIQLDYPDLLKEYLLFKLLKYNGEVWIPFDSAKIKLLFKEIDPLFSTWALKDFFKRMSHVLNEGEDLIDFSFNDLKGKPVTKGQFAGKVLVIDIWFTGCRGCLMYADSLEKSVYPNFKGDSNVVFLSICGNISKSQWIASVNQGKYTRKENLNVYTNGLGFTHPFMRYYDFDGAPFSLIIDRQGKIVATELNHGSMSNMVKIIRETLQ